MKKILILTAGYGEGHNAAARGIRDGLARIAPNIEVELHDLFAETLGALHELIRKAYLTLINRWPRSWGNVYRWLDQKTTVDRDLGRFFSPIKNQLAHLLARFQPDVVVSSFPPYPYLLTQILGPNQILPERCRCHRLDHGQRNLVSVRRRLFSRSERAERSRSTQRRN